MNKILALITFSGAMFISINCANNEDAQKDVKEDIAQLQELIAQYDALENQSQNYNRDEVFDIAKLKEEALALFAKFDNEGLKQKIGANKDFRQILIGKFLYPKNKLNLSAQEAIKAYEEQLAKSFASIIRLNIFNLIRLYKNKNLTDYIGMLMYVLPVEFKGEKIKLGDFFPGPASGHYPQTGTDLNVNIIGAILKFESIDFLIRFLELSESLNKTISSKEGSPLLVIMKMHDFGKNSPKVDKAKLKQAIAELLANGTDINKKDGFGKNFLDYVNEQDDHGNLVRPEINKIYREYEEYKKAFNSTVAQTLVGLPAALTQIIFKYTN